MTPHIVHVVAPPGGAGVELVCTICESRLKLSTREDLQCTARPSAVIYWTRNHERCLHDAHQEEMATSGKLYVDAQGKDV